MSDPLKSGHSFIRQATVRKKQASLPAFFRTPKRTILRTILKGFRADSEVGIHINN
jgi:hypothetical protein